MFVLFQNGDSDEMTSLEKRARLSSLSGHGRGRGGVSSLRRGAGLSLSIDASLKVLREALYLEIARKKQQENIARARQNKQILETIG